MAKCFLAFSEVHDVGALHDRLVVVGLQTDARAHDLGGLFQVLLVLDELRHAVPDLGHLEPVSAALGQALGVYHEHVVDDARHVRAGVDGRGTGHLLQRLPAVRLPGDDGVDVARLQRLRGLIGRHVDDLDVLVGQVGRSERVHQQQMADETDLDADLLALELSHARDAGLGNDHVVAVAVVVDDDPDAGGIAARARHQCVTVGDTHGIDLAGGVGLHRRHVVEPLEVDGDPGFLEPALLDGDIPGDPARPVAVQNLQRGSAGLGDRRRCYRNWRRRGGCGRGGRPSFRGAGFFRVLLHPPRKASARASEASRTIGIMS